MYWYIYTYIHTCIHTYIHTCIEQFDFFVGSKYFRPVIHWSFIYIVIIYGISKSWMKCESRSWPQPVFHAMMLLVLSSLSYPGLGIAPQEQFLFTRFCGGTCRSFLRTSQFFCWWNTTFCWRNWRSCHPSLQQAFPAWLLLQLRLSTCQLGLFFIDAFSLGGHGKEITGSDFTKKNMGRNRLRLLRNPKGIVLEQSPNFSSVDQSFSLKHLQNYG